MPARNAVAFGTMPSALENISRVVSHDKGGWIAIKPFTGIASFWITGELYSIFPQSYMARLVEKYLDAKRAMDEGDALDMIVFWNSTLGQA